MNFFFYGTLLDGSDNAAARAVHALLAPLGPATVAGRMAAVPDADGWYPALLPGDGLVHGRLFAARPGPASRRRTSPGSIPTKTMIRPGPPARSTCGGTSPPRRPALP